MIDIRTEIRQAFAREQSAFPPPVALRAQVIEAIHSRARVAVPLRQRTDRNWTWLMVAAAALVTIAIVAGMIIGRLINPLSIPVQHGPAPQICLPGPTDPLNRFARIHGCITYTDGSQIIAVDPFHTTNRIALGPSNGRLPIAWSRDGLRLLLISCVSGGCDLFVMNPDGSQVRLTNGDADGWQTASFSRDGTSVVYGGFAAPGNYSMSGLYVIDVGSGSRRLIAASTTCSDPAGCIGDSYLEYPAWSPDGSRIAYADYKNRDEIWSMNPDGSDQRRLLDLGKCGAFQLSGCTTNLAWSPDGSQLAFRFGPEQDSPDVKPIGIYVVRNDGSGLRRISADGGQPTWSPDGSHIAFTLGGHLYTMAADGSGVTLMKDIVVVPNYSWAWNPGT